MLLPLAVCGGKHVAVATTLTATAEPTSFPAASFSAVLGGRSAVQVRVGD